MSKNDFSRLAYVIRSFSIIGRYRLALDVAEEFHQDAKFHRRQFMERCGFPTSNPIDSEGGPE